MLRIYKCSILVFDFTTIMTLIVLLRINCENDYCSSIENVTIGIFASSILMLASSIISYCVQEATSIREFYWRLIELKGLAHELATVPINNKSIYRSYESIKAIDLLLTEYYATLDLDYICYRRKKIQKILEIHFKLEKLKHETEKAKMRYGEYINAIESIPQKNYSFEEFKEDIRSFTELVDNYEGEGLLVIWLQNRCEELGELVFSTKIK